MERPNSYASQGLGRGRPSENSLARRPYTTYASDIEYVPTEGSNNFLRLGTADASRHDMSPNIHHNSTPIRGVPEKKFELSPLAKEFVPRNFHPESQAVPSQISTTIDTSMDSYPIQELRNFLCEITMNPGMFESKIEPLGDCFRDYVEDGDTLRAIVNIIFDESVRQPNFRYNGARLCKYLCNELSSSPDQMNFRQLLLQRCNQELKRRVHLAESDDGGAYLRGFGMFLAELLTQVEMPNQRIQLFGESLTAVIRTLLEHPSCDNLKCICQILKLVGAYLEDTERSKIPSHTSESEMEKTITTLKTVSESDEYPRDIKAMLCNVVELRSSDWGRASDNEPVVEDHSPPTSLNEPVMYGPDGKPLTPEESLFLHTQYSYHASDAEEYDTYDDNGDEMEEEIQAAYEVFLNEFNH